MNTSAEYGSDPGSQPAPKMTMGEILLLSVSVLSLIASCIVWSSRKQAWMDEIFTWKEVSDRSLWHLYSAIQHGADGGQPLFYTTVWLWAKAFGSGVLDTPFVLQRRNVRRFVGYLENHTSLLRSLGYCIRSSDHLGYLGYAP